MKTSTAKSLHGRWGKAYQSECAPDKGGRLHLLKSSAQGVYLVLVSHSREGIAFPSVGSIANGLGCSESTVHRGLKSLLHHGLIEVDVRGGGRSSGGDGRSTKYRITPPLLPAEHGSTTVNGASGEGVNSGSGLDPTTNANGNPVTVHTLSPSNPVRRNILPNANPSTTDPKPCHTEPENLSPMTPEESKKEMKQKGACCNDLRSHLLSLGVKGGKLDELTALPDLTTEQTDAVYAEAQAKSRDSGNAVGLMITMLLDGERGAKRCAANEQVKRREESAAGSQQHAKECLEQLPEADDPAELEAARSWLHKFGRLRVFSIAKEATPQLRVKDHNGVATWLVPPNENDRVLVACYCHDRDNYTVGAKFAAEWAAKQSDGAAF